MSVKQVYYVIAAGEILYVGMAGKQGLRSRWTNNAGYGLHHELAKLKAIDRHNRVRIAYWVRPLWRVKHDEAVEIRRFQPPLNDRLEPTVWWIGWLDNFDAALRWAVFFLIPIIVWMLP